MTCIKLLESAIYRWDAMKKFTSVILKLISDTEKHQFIENMIRSGIFVTSKSCSEADNKF